METALADIETRSEAEGITAAELGELAEEALEAGFAFLGNATPADAAHPFDLTFLMADAGLSTGEGWSVAPTINYSCGEFYQLTFDFYQTIEGLPAGTYQFKGQGFQRPGAASAVYNAYTEGQNDVTAVIYAGADEQQLAHIASEARTSKLGGSESAVGSAPVRYIPNDMQSASLYFAAGLYENGVVTELTEDESDLQVGIRNDYTADSYWCIFDNFHLYYYGSMSPGTVTGIHDIKANTSANEDAFSAPADIYDLSGISVRRKATSTEGLKPGIYIVNHKKIAVW